MKGLKLHFHHNNLRRKPSQINNSHTLREPGKSVQYKTGMGSLHTIMTWVILPDAIVTGLCQIKLLYLDNHFNKKKGI